MKLDGRNNFTLSSGRTFKANRGILGISLSGESDEAWGIFDGYDGVPGLWDEAPLSPIERREIADTMIAAWKEWSNG